MQQTKQNQAGEFQGGRNKKRTAETHENGGAKVSLAANGWSRRGCLPGGGVLPEGPRAIGHLGILRGAGCWRPGGV